MTMENLYHRVGEEGMTVGAVDKTSIVTVMWLGTCIIPSLPHHCNPNPSAFGGTDDIQGFPFLIHM